ncbi:MAG TPA: tyrosine-type recombinase/integrase [Casimicrobiaceae bacterium]|nr:tyrosine-type recombinase/integrase [Casimicrobiaceae bacterium]
MRAHDLKHTFGHRLEAAGVSDRDCQVLLGHARKGVTRQYMAPEVARIAASGRVGAESGATRNDTADDHPQKGCTKNPSLRKWHKSATTEKWPGRPER